MPRPPRLHLDGGVYHVMLRGNAGQDIFFEAADRRFFYRLLEEGSERFGYRLHGFCLMTNHLHLVLQVGEVPLPRLMHNLALRYSRRVNWRRARLGHLFQGRYKALLVDADSYLLELVRYVHLNPLRAKLARRPEAYPWSGHRAYLGLEDLPWLTTDWVLGQFGRRLGPARRAYAAFVAEGIGQGHREEFHRGAADSRVLADEAFVKRLPQPDPTPPPEPPALEALLAAVSAAYGLAPEELAGPSRRRRLAEARGVLGLLARDSGAASLSAVAARCGRDLSSLSRAVRRAELRRAEDADFAARLRALGRETMQ